MLHTTLFPILFLRLSSCSLSFRSKKRRARRVKIRGHSLGFSACSVLVTMKLRHQDGALHRQVASRSDGDLARRAPCNLQPRVAHQRGYGNRALEAARIRTVQTAQVHRRVSGRWHQHRRQLRKLFEPRLRAPRSCPCSAPPSAMTAAGCAPWALNPTRGTHDGSTCSNPS